jgi:hypothetical protein
LLLDASYRESSLILALAPVVPLPGIGVDLRVANGSMLESSAISGTAAEVKSL